MNLDALDDEPVPPVFFTENQRRNAPASPDNIRIPEDWRRQMEADPEKLPKGFEHFFDNDKK